MELVVLVLLLVAIILVVILTRNVSNAPNHTVKRVLLELDKPAPYVILPLPNISTLLLVYACLAIL